MPMIDVYPTPGKRSPASDLAQQLAAAVMRRGQVPPVAHRPLREKEIGHASLNRLSHQDTGQKDRRPVGARTVRRF
jgi:hypothetical protein